METKPVRAVISVHAPTAASKATLLPDQAADGADFQEVCHHVAGELPPPVEGFELLAYFLQFVIAYHGNTPTNVTPVCAIERPMTPIGCTTN
jgi:hypothetical protein